MRKIISLITLFSFSLQAATITDDKLTVGKKASASAKEIVFDTNDGANNKKLSVDKITKKLSATSDEVIVGDGTASDKALTFNRGGSNASIKWDEATAKLKFANDGASFKDLGSGTGGGGSTGVNLLANDSFEDAVGGVISDWSNTGGTFSQQTYTNGVEGDLKYARFVASTSGQYVETTAVAIPTSFSGGCQADFKKVNISTAGLFKIQALDVSNNVLAEQTIGVSAWIKVPTITFPCPAAATMVKLRLISLAAGTIDFDRGYIGSNQNLVYSSQARLMGTVKITGCAADWTNGSTSFSSFVVQTGCVYTTSGSALSPSTNLPAIKFTSLPAGDYRLEYEGKFGSTIGGKSAYLQFSDGTNTARENSTVLHAQALFVNGLSQSISYGTAQSNVTFEIKAKNDSSGFTNLSGTNAIPGVIKVWYFPSQSEVAVSNEQSSWFIDANIGGANPAYTTIRSSYTEMNGSSWDMVVNSAKGSAPAEIPCQNTNASTGLTCSGVDESMGIVFTPPSAGRYQVCASGTFLTSATNGDGVFQLVETPNNAQTILQEGGTRTAVSGSSADVAQSVYQCGNFVFSDTSKRTIRWMHEKPTATTLTPLTDRSASAGQRDFKFTVENITFGQGRPVLTGDQVTTSGTINPKRFYATWGTCTVTPCTLTSNKGGVITSVIRNSTGSYSPQFSGLTNPPICQYNAAGERQFFVNAPTSSSATVTSRDSAGVAGDSSYNVFSCDSY